MRALFVCAGLLLTPAACQKPDATPPPEAAGARPAQAVEEGAPDATEQAEFHVVWPEAVVDAQRWLQVEGVREGEEGAWATGSFLPKRNKLDIRTNGVSRFAIDTGRIGINWNRIVILGINGANSELRRRDLQVYHFERNAHGQWVVLEP